MAAWRQSVAARRQSVAAWRHGGKAWRHDGKAGGINASGGKAWRHGGMAAKMPPGGKDSFAPNMRRPVRCLRELRRAVRLPTMLRDVHHVPTMFIIFHRLLPREDAQQIVDLYPTDRRGRQASEHAEDPTHMQAARLPRRLRLGPR
eukprot:gene2881-biopygen3960